MRVKFTNQKLVLADSILCGQVFTAPRKSKDDIGVYMRVDEKSGICNFNGTTGLVYAVNLSTGQLRKFTVDTLVEVVDATVEIR